MSDTKTIVVVGATGAQGGGLVRAILDDPGGGFSVRAITRDPNSDKARKLRAEGAEVVQADLDDVESLKKAFEGAYGVFGVTNFWEHYSAEKELQQAKNMSEAAKAAGVEHFVWSTLEDTRKRIPLDSDRMPTLQGKYKVPHFDGKGEADEVFRQVGVPTTFLLTSFYWDNFIHFGMGPQPGPDGTLTIAFPMGDKRLPGIAAEDIGRCAYGIFKEGKSLIGQTVGIAGEHLSGADIAAKIGQAIGQKVSFYPIEADAFRALDFPGADEMGNMFQYKRDFNEEFVGARSIARSRELNPRLQSFDDWLKKHASEIPLPAHAGV